MSLRNKVALAVIAVAIVAIGVGAAEYRSPKSITTNGEPALGADVMTSMTDSTTTIPTASIAEVSTTPVGFATPGPTTTTKKMNDVAPSSSNIPTSASAQTSTPSTATTNRTPVTAPLADQQALANETVAIVCIKPITAGSVGLVNYGTGVIVNENGYILTNEHIIGDTTFCYMGKTRAVPRYLQTIGPAPTIALYYSLTFIGGGIGVTDSSETSTPSSFHDFAIFKIDAKMPRSEWQSDQAPPEIRTLSALTIPWATDAEYAQFSPSGTFPAITINFDYQPVRGDLLSMGGYIADSGMPDYTFTSGDLGVVSTTIIEIAMPSGQGMSGSPVVDSQGNLVALNFAADCGAWNGCYTSEDPSNAGFSSFTYGNQSLVLTVPFIDQAMKQDLGFGLRDLVTMQ